jgi:hypothetical protein
MPQMIDPHNRAQIQERERRVWDRYLMGCRSVILTSAIVPPSVEGLHHRGSVHKEYELLTRIQFTYSRRSCRPRPTPHT